MTHSRVPLDMPGEHASEEGALHGEGVGKVRLRRQVPKCCQRPEGGQETRGRRLQQGWEGRGGPGWDGDLGPGTLLEGASEAEDEVLSPGGALPLPASPVVTPVTGLTTSFGVGCLRSLRAAAPQTAFVPQFPSLYKGTASSLQVQTFPGCSAPSCQGER